MSIDNQGGPTLEIGSNKSVNEGKTFLAIIILINMLALIAVIIEIALVPFTPFIIGLNVILLPHLSQHLKEPK